jgi:ribonuclease P protein component
MITIKKNFEFRKVLSRGNFVNGNNVAIYFFPNKLNIIRYGFAIGKKAGKAVSRNRIKRILREIARITPIETEKGMDVVFVWKNRISAKEVDFFEIKKEIENLLKKGKNSEETSVKGN